jgi:FkbM family methyltransferase
MSAKTLARRFLPLPAFSRLVYFRDCWMTGEWELRELHRIVPKQGLAIDVGANVGVYSYRLKRLGHRVVSFEPDPAYQERLKSLLGPDARIEAVALSSAGGSGVMRVPNLGEAYGGGRASLSDEVVPDDMVSTSYDATLRTLDSYDFDDVAFLKIDVEGHEEDVLAGAAKTLERSTPTILIEIEERFNRGGVARVSQNLARLGYKGSFYYKRKRHDISEFVPEIHQTMPAGNAKNMSRRELVYVNNFVFVAT